MVEDITFLAPLSALRKRTRLAKMVPVMRARGHKIRFFGWERIPGEAAGFAWEEPGVREDVLMRGGGYASGKARALYPLLMAKVFWRTLRLGRGKLLFCLGWETAFPALLAARFTGARIVFDDADRFSMIVRLPGAAGRLLPRLEEWASRRAALHVIPGFSRYEWRHDRMVVLRNSPLGADFAAAVAARPERPEAAVVLYANGWIGETRGAPIFLEALELAAERGLDLHMVIAGRVDGKSAPKLIDHANVTFCGEVTQHEALGWYIACDAVLTFYDPAIVINRMAESNKWGDAVFFNCPIIVNSEVETARPFIEAGAAFAMPYHKTDMLVDLFSRMVKTPDILDEARRALIPFKSEFPIFDTQLDMVLERVLPRKVTE